MGCQHWVKSADYGTHSFRRTKASLIYRQTKNLRAVKLLLGHAKLESTVRYLGIEVVEVFARDGVAHIIKINSDNLAGKFNYLIKDKEFPSAEAIKNAIKKTRCQ